MSGFSEKLKNSTTSVVLCQQLHAAQSKPASIPR